MVFRTTPQLGPQLDDTIAEGAVWFEAPVHSYASTQPDIISPQLGTVEFGSDGYQYMLVKSSASISAASSPGTQLAIDEAAYTAAAGSEGWYAPVAGVADDTYFWARKGSAV